MQIKLLVIGKTDKSEIKNLMNYYIHRFPKYFNFEIVEIPDLKLGKTITPEVIKNEEAKLFLSHLESSDYIVLLDEKGKEFSSVEFSEKLNFWKNNSMKRLIFLVGGAYGFSNEIYKKANEKLSLSKMTFTHQMIRLFFLEQLYRADQILQGKPYHNN